MITANSELMKCARTALAGKWGFAAGITLVYFLISAVVGTPKYLQIAAFVISGPMALGYNSAILALARREECRFNTLFDGFKNFLTAFLAMLLMMVFIVLRLLLLIVPGLMAALSYSMTYFVIADNPGIRAYDALRKSRDLMYGHRWRFSCLLGRFTGWIILGILTCGIGFFWIFPYMMTAGACFYRELVDKNSNGARSGSLIRPARQSV